MLRCLLTAVAVWMIGILNAQTFTATGGSIPDNDTVFTCFPLSVSGVGNIDKTSGLASVQINITHSYVGDLDIRLKAPDGTIIPLSIRKGGNGKNFTNTTFNGTATNGLYQGTAPFTGTYAADGILGMVNNGQNGNGVWNLCIRDYKVANVGNLTNWALTFSNQPAISLAPTCTGSAGATNTCGASPLVCDFGGLCGSTSADFAVFTWPELTAAFLSCNPPAGIQNNSFIRFIASASSVSFSVWVYNSKTHGGIQTMFFDGGCGSGAVTKYGCVQQIVPSNFKPTTISASGFIPGKTYFLMFDGYGGDVCDYTIQPIVGVSALNIKPNNPSLCKGDVVTLTASGGSSKNYTWSPALGLNKTSGDTVTLNSSALPIGYHTITLNGTSTGTCPASTQMNVRVDGPLTVSTQPSTANPNYNLNAAATPLTVSTSLSTATYQWYSNTTNSNTGGTLLTGAINSSYTPSTSVGGSTYYYCVLTNGTCGATSNVSGKITVLTPTLCNTPDSLTFVQQPNNVVQGSPVNPAITVKIYCSATGSTALNYTGNVTLTASNGGCGYVSQTVKAVAGIATFTNVVFTRSSQKNITLTATAVGITNGVKSSKFDVGVPTGGGTTAVTIKNEDFDPASPKKWPFTTLAGGLDVSGVVNPAGNYYLRKSCSGDFASGVSESTTTFTFDNLTGLTNYSNLKFGFKVASLNKSGTVAAPSGAGVDTNEDLVVETSTDGGASWQKLITHNGFSNKLFPFSNAFVLTISNLGADATIGTTDKTSAFSVGIPSGVSQFRFRVTATANRTEENWCIDDITLIGDSTSAANPSLLPLAVLGADTTICKGNAATLHATVSNTVGTVSYTWSPAATLVNANVANPVTNNITTNQTYSLIIKDGDNCIDTADNAMNVNLSLPPLLQSQVTVTDTAKCLGDTLKALQVTALQTESYQWYATTAPSKTGGTAITGANAPTYIPSSSTAGTLYYYCVLGGSCNPKDTSAVSGAIVTQNSISRVANAKGAIINANDLVPSISDSTNFGSIATGAFVTRTFTIRAGTVPLIISNFQVTGDASFSVGAVTPSSPIPANGTATFTITCSPSSPGVKNATIVINNNSCNAATYDFAVTANATFVSQPASALDFDGINDYVSIPHNTKLKPSKQITIEAWVNPRDIHTNKYYEIYRKEDGNDRHLFSFQENGTILSFGLNVGGVYKELDIAISAANYENKWVHVAATFDGLTKKVYANGVLIGSQAAIGSIGTTGTAPAFIGLNQQVMQEQFNGKIDEFRLWGRALCPAELLQSMNCELKGAQDSLILYYRFNQGLNGGANSGVNTLIDSSGNGFNGTLINFALSGTTSNWVNPGGVTTGSYCTPFVNPIVANTINASPKDSICPRTLVTFTATATNGGTAPTYQWFKNKSVVGTNSATYQDSTLVKGDSVYCVLTSNDLCALQPKANSNTLSIYVKDTTISSTNASICNGNTYTFNGNTYSTSGTYSAKLANSVGCDSTAYLLLTVKDTTSSTTAFSICSGSGYFFNGTIFSTAGTYSFKLKNAVGCDSMAYLLLTVKDTTASTTTASICKGNSYVFNGITYNTSGTYSAKLVNSVGCDSTAYLVLTFNDTTSSTTTASICKGNSYVFNGMSYNTAGTYSAKLVNSVGCDSTAYLVLTFNDTTSSTTTASICKGNSYVFNGTSYTTAGTYFTKLVNSVGCDSTAYLVLTVKDTTTSTTTVSICKGNSFLFNGTSYTTAGTYFAKLVNSVGCDSTAYLVLTFKDTTSSTTTASICKGISYVFNGTSYTTAGTYFVKLVNSVGCDSTAYLVLTVKDTTNSTTTASICKGNSYLFNGTSYTTAGTYFTKLVNSVGCDSTANLVLTLKDTTSSTTTVSICKGNNYVFNGTSYTTAGTYFAKLVNSVGCDSTAYLVLTVKDTTASTTTVSICKGNSYLFNGTSYTTAGTYFTKLVNNVGCDSTAYLLLTVKDTTASTTTVSICKGNNYVFNGTSYTTAGTYSAKLVNSVGCDSTAYLVLTLKDTTSSTTTASICKGNSYVFNGTSYNTAGTYFAKLVNSVGCDSTAYLVLTVKDTTASTTTVSICKGNSYLFNGTSYTTAGTYFTKLVNNVGCDSTAYLLLTEKDTTASTTTVSICKGNNYVFNGTSYTTAGTYSAKLVNSVGCDSTAYLVLTLKDTTSSTTTASICKGNSYVFNGTSYNTAGTYFAKLVNSVGCDSTAYLVLTVKDTTSSTTTVSICKGNSYIFNGTSYTTAGTYFTKLVNSVGCDSTAYLLLTVKDTTKSTTTASICKGNSYVFNGTSYNTAGTYFAKLVNSVGCDSTAYLVLTVKDTTSSTTTASICKGNNYVFNGTSYNAAGTYFAKLVNSVGCDSTAYLVLTVKDTTASTTTVSICKGNSYVFNGTSYTTAGTYFTKLVNSVGCDSTAYLVLTVKDTSASTTTVSICKGNSFLFNGTSFTTAGTYFTKLVNSVGCDSTAYLVLKVNDTTSSTTTISICKGNSYVFNGTAYNLEGTYSVKLVNSTGCDSMAYLVLTIIDKPAVDAIIGQANVEVLESVVLTNNTVGGIWGLDATNIATIDINGSVKGISPGKATVSYKLSNICGDTIAYFPINVIEMTVFIPNTFSPNNDGNNDVFYVRGKASKYEQVQLSIFNSWGNLIFESKGAVDDKSIGWNGSSKGVIQPSGVYLFVAKVTNKRGEVEIKKGAINLIR